MDQICRQKVPYDVPIPLLISGIGSQSLRNTAAALRVNTIDEFLDEMHQIIATTSDGSKRQQANQHSTKKEEQRCNSCGKAGHIAKNCSKPKAFCVYCKTTGHLRNDCLKLKRKEQPGTSASTSAATAVSTVQPDEESSETITLIQDSGMKIQTSNLPLNVTQLNNLKCNLFALVDTGSPLFLLFATMCIINICAN